MADLTESAAVLYDRQIRLWGEHMQQRLLKSRICVIGFSHAQVEMMKNLVLAGFDLLFAPTLSNARIENQSRVAQRLTAEPNFLFTESQRHQFSNNTMEHVYECAAKSLGELNRDSKVQYITKLDLKLLISFMSRASDQTAKKILAIILSIGSAESQLILKVNQLCREQNMGFILLSDDESPIIGAYFDLASPQGNPSLETFMNLQLSVLLKSLKSKTSSKKTSSAIAYFQGYLQRMLKIASLATSPTKLQSSQITDSRFPSRQSSAVKSALSAIMGGFISEQKWKRASFKLLAQVIFRWIQFQRGTVINIGILDGASLECFEINLECFMSPINKSHS